MAPIKVVMDRRVELSNEHWLILKDIAEESECGIEEILGLIIEEWIAGLEENT